ncbi:MAG TPA: CYTH domain-containing protein [Draconibacterium sp.]|nr:CYTH domain-containing protein [Draconibacterium sp.]
MVEIERKFLIKTGLWKPTVKGIKISQGYLSIDSEKVIRVRIADDLGFITIKGKANGIVRTELEYEIPKNEAEVLLKMCNGFIVEKTRFKENFLNMTWEVDIFEGKNKGLFLAEIELENENQEFELPDWVGEEVTFDYHYHNSWLSKQPFLQW